jgi:hypothetical protein
LRGAGYALCGGGQVAGFLIVVGRFWTQDPGPMTLAPSNGAR